LIGGYRIVLDANVIGLKNQNSRDIGGALFGLSATRKLSFAATWMNRRLFVEVILACNLSKESNA
jgi:hypothetical protein